MLPSNLTGSVLDDKYRIERELGRGGMGAVYLATHLGTERPVAVKVIAPEFMTRGEFVERFRREARAAGRLRHPNVVDVTDFGFSHIDGQSVAYLVMEYLDGCSLADILAEEKSLPMAWVVDIIEQTCAAVDEAHKKGIVHRDLKPDNIWLEPNRRGGYTVKVLDFGLAKLAQPGTTSEGQEDRGHELDSPKSLTTHINPQPESLTVHQRPVTTTDARSNEFAATLISRESGSTKAGEETATLISSETQSEAAQSEAAQSNAGSGPDNVPNDDDVKTRILPSGEETNLTNPLAGGNDHSNATAVNQVHATAGPDRSDGLTRVGAIMGTPLYMSPEQCAGQNIDYRADIYSLGVIAYQMIAGQPPFAGDTTEVMKQHREAAPVPVGKRRRKVSRSMSRTVMAALAKDPAARPESAAAFASAMRASLEGIGSLLRRTVALCSENFTRFFVVSLAAQLPVIACALLRTMLDTFRYHLNDHSFNFLTSVLLPLLQTGFNFLASMLVIGVTIRLVTQLYVAPLRPISLRNALAALKHRAWALVQTAIMVVIGIVVGLALLVIPGIIFYINTSLTIPVVVMEGLKGRAAMRRSKALVKRSRWTVIVILLIQYLIPSLTASLVLTVVIGWFHGMNAGQAQLVAGLTSVIAAALNVVIVPIIATLTALLYLKTRMLGGEVLRDMISDFENEDAPKTRWQQKMRSTIYSPSGSRITR